MKQLERQIHELQKELAEVLKKRDALRLRPCRGDVEIQQKQQLLEELDHQTSAFREKMQELEKRRREQMSGTEKICYESPFN